MPTKTRREKIAALANTADYNPNEAANAAAILAKTPESSLERIATDIKAEYGKGIEAQFAIGRLLNEAYALFGNTQDYGHWFAEQDFQFGKTVARLLRAGADREDEVRLLLASRKSGSRDISVQTAVEYMERAPAPSTPQNNGDEDVVDQNYAALRRAFNLIGVVVNGEPTGNAFLSMHVEDMAKSAGYIKVLAKLYNDAKAAR